MYLYHLVDPHIERGSCMVWEINMGVCPRLDFDNIMLFNCIRPLAGYGLPLPPGGIL